jgi:hypothetical protein
MPVVHVVIDLAELHQGSKAVPLQLPRVVDRVAAISRASGGARVLHDVHLGVEFARQCRERGVTCEQVGMTNADQAVRAQLLAQLVRGGRFHVACDGGRELVRQLAGLKVTELSGGKIRIEGRHDDLADAALLAIERAASGKLVPSGGDIEFEWRRPRWTGRELVGNFERVFFKTLPNGDRQWVEPPLNTPEWELYVQRSLERGQSSDRIERWLEQQTPEHAAELDPRRRLQELSYNANINRRVY